MSLFFVYPCVHNTTTEPLNANEKFGRPDKLGTPAQEYDKALREFQEITEKTGALFDSLSPVDQEEMIEEYCNFIEVHEGYKPSRLEVAMRVLQYISPEWKLKTDQMVREYLLSEANSFSKTKFSDDGERKTQIRHLKTIFE